MSRPAGNVQTQPLVLGTAVTRLPFHSDQLGRQDDMFLVKARNLKLVLELDPLLSPSVAGSHTFYAARWDSSISSIHI